MPSPFLRLPQKTCGLFDIGSAGSTSDAVSFGVNAPAADPLAASNYESLKLLADFEPGTVLSPEDPFHHYPPLSGVDTSTQFNKASVFEQPAATTAVFSDANTGDWGELGDPLADLETDPLGDESLDAFINLDQLLAGDAFLDEVNEVKPVIDMTPQTVEPVISIPSPAGGDNQQLDFFDLLDCVSEVTPVSQNPSPFFSVTPPTVETTSSTVVISKGASRKRKATSKAAPGPIKTSMFEIPKPISEDTVSTTTTTTFTSPCSPELDHDYTTKSKVIEVPFEEPAIMEADAGTSKGLPDKQSIRRHKNNIASKRSREQRKQKFSELDREAEELVEKNEALRLKIAELEKVAREMKAVLVAKMSGK